MRDPTVEGHVSARTLRFSPLARTMSKRHLCLASETRRPTRCNAVATSRLADTFQVDSMDLFIADDARQRTPTREGMGSLVAAGGLYFTGNGWVGATERAIDAMCTEAGFPPGEEFKWSPSRGSWMHRNLVGPERAAFFAKVLAAPRRAEARAIVVIEDTKYKRATSAKTPEDDVTRLLLERVETEMSRADVDGLVIADRPGGGGRDENKFLGRCLEMLRAGTDYVKHKHIALNVVSAPSEMIRVLQLADLVTSCTLAYVAGEDQYAPTTFPHVRALMGGSVGGASVKIHPDIKYVNLYHWLFGDTHYYRGNVGHPLPRKNNDYALSPSHP
jgi:hypothetical protein